MTIHSAKPVPYPEFLYHHIEILEPGKPNKENSGKAIITGWSTTIEKGDSIDIPHLRRLFNVVKLTKRDHNGIFSEGWGYDSERGKNGELKGFFAYKKTEKNKNSFFTAECVFTPQKEN